MNSQNVVRQYAAELLGAVLIDLFPGTELVECAATEHGFVCDFLAEQPVDEQSLVLLEEKMRALIKENVEVRPIEMMQENAAQYLEHKGQFIRAAEVRRAKDNIITLIQIGDFCDFCPLPSISDTGDIGAFKLYQIEEVLHYLPEEGTIRIRRIHGTATDDKMALKKLNKVRDAAKKGNYLQYAKELKLFTLQNNISEKSLVWLTNGTILKQILIDWWNSEHRQQNYQVVATPQLVKEELVRKSGIYDALPLHEESPMMVIDGADYIIPPSLTPSHAALFAAGTYFGSELPVRLAEIGVVSPLENKRRPRGLHHTDLVTGDYAHSFCDFQQLESEIISSLQFIDKIIKMFGFEVYWYFIGRGDKYAGTVKQWDQASRIFEDAFSKNGTTFVTAEQEFSYAGPVVEAQVTDVFGRVWKGPKITLDFNLPSKMKLRSGGTDAPLLLVRTVFESLERQIMLLLEQFKGVLPLWLAPEQVRVFPVKEEFNEYAEKVGKQLTQAGLRAIVDCGNEPLGKKIYGAECEKTPYVVVVGEKEENNNQVTLRSCDDEAQLQTMTSEELIRKLSGEVSSKARRGHVA